MPLEDLHGNFLLFFFPAGTCFQEERMCLPPLFSLLSKEYCAELSRTLFCDTDKPLAFWLAAHEREEFILDCFQGSLEMIPLQKHAHKERRSGTNRRLSLFEVASSFFFSPPFFRLFLLSPLDFFRNLS